MAGCTIAFIGGGNMAMALVEGAMASALPDLAPGHLVVAEPDSEKRKWFAARGLKTVASTRDLGQLLDPSSQLLLAVKPQALAEVACDLAGLDLSRVVISILAGTPSQKIHAATGGKARVIRAMPNTPARVGQGATAIALGRGSQPGDEALAERLFKGLGPFVLRIDEDLMDAFTAVAASGPAYVFFLAEAMTRAAVDVGFEPKDADRMVRQTLAGASALLCNGSDSAHNLRMAVTSKGGTTEAAVGVLNEAGVADAVVRAIVAARDRGRALGGGSGSDR